MKTYFLSIFTHPRTGSLPLILCLLILGSCQIPEENASGGPPYTVVFNSRGGTPESVTRKTDPEGKVIFPGETPRREGYELIGWYTGRNGQGNNIEEGNKIEADTILYAQWKLIVSVTFNALDGTFPTGEKTLTLNAGDSGTVNFPPQDPVHSTFIFQGWYTSPDGAGKKLNAGYRVDDSITVYASWLDPASLPPYPITFDARGGIPGSQQIDTDANGIVRLPSADPVREGYEFKGWYTGLNGGGTKIGSSYQAAGQQTFYAWWVEAADPNGPWKSLAYTPEILGNPAVYAENSGTMTIKYSDKRQIIDGFGGSNAWYDLPSNTQTADQVIKLLYSRTEGAGLTILRNRIPFKDSSDDFVNKSSNNYTYTANADGTKTFSLNWNAWEVERTRNLITRIKNLSNGPEKLVILSTPWTPPNNSTSQWKNGSTSEIGGTLKPEKYNDYADLLADYAKNFSARMGADLALLSVQNEPSTHVSYESCEWSGEQIRNFLVLIGERFKLKNVQSTLGIMAPEDENFREDLITASLGNSAARSVLTHVGLHQYEAGYVGDSGKLGAERLSNVSAAGKRIWQTEASGAAGGSSLVTGTGINNAIFYAKMIHHDMTLPEVNAFLYWWLYRVDTSDSKDEGLVHVSGAAVSTPKRLWALGNFSRFVRPGWRRLGSTVSPASGVYTSAYGSDSGDMAIVCINETGSAKNITINLEGGTFATGLKAYRTSAAENLAEISAPGYSGGSIGITLASQSVTTLAVKKQ
jgi:uncharacterized repeat protein (TIGR02543 family)